MDDRDDLRIDVDLFDNSNIVSSNLVDLHGDAYIYDELT